MNKKILKYSLIGMAFFMCSFQGASAFGDVHQNDWFYGDVLWAQNQGYVDNTGYFFPQRAINRAEFSKILAKSFNINRISTESETFSDVPLTAWFAEDVYALKSQGIVNGRSWDLFEPSASITREEVAKTVFLAGDFAPAAPEAGIFYDVAQTRWSSSFITALAHLNVLKGYNDSSFRPEQNINRAEAIAIIHRAIQAKSSNQNPQPTPTPSPNPVPTPNPSPNPQSTPSPVPSPAPTPNPNPAPQPSPSPTPAPSPAMDNQSVSFAGPDGIILTARIYKPAGNGPFSAMVMMHGCSGLLTNNGDIGSEYVYWGQHLRDQENVVSIFIDSFSPRNIMNGVCNQNSLPSLILNEATERPKDAYAALTYLRSLNYIRTNKIGIMGWSNGGSATLSSVARDNNPVAMPAAGGFIGAVTEYPGCGLQGHYSTDYSTSNSLTKGTYIPYVNTHIYAAQNDTTTPPDPKCVNLVNRAKSLGASAQSNNDITLTIYPGAQHSFDRAKEGDPSWTIADITARDQARSAIFPYLHGLLQ